MRGARRQLRRLAACAVLAVPANVLIAWSLALWAPVPGLYCPDPTPLPPSIFGLGPHAEFRDKRCYARPGYLEAEWRLGATDREHELEIAIAGPHDVEEIRVGFPFHAMRGLKSQFNPYAADFARHRKELLAGERAFSIYPSRPLQPLPTPTIHMALVPPRWLQARDTNRLIPLRPIWPGFVANWIVLTSSHYALFTFALFVRDRFRQRRGLCPRCAYELVGMIEDGCPECGWRRT